MAYLRFRQQECFEAIKHGVDFLRNVHRNPATGGYAWILSDSVRRKLLANLGGYSGRDGEVNRILRETIKNPAGPAKRACRPTYPKSSTALLGNQPSRGASFHEI
jgi:hypothetical protein